MSIEKYNLQIAEVFRREGYDGASMSRISEATGLQKGSLYHHYPNGKKDMAIAAIKATHETYKTTTKDAFHPQKPIRQQLEDWAEGVRQFYSNGDANCILGTITISGGKDEFPTFIKQAFQNWITSLELILTNSGMAKKQANEAAFAAIERIQGALIVARALENTSNFHSLIKQLPDILLKPWQGMK